MMQPLCRNGTSKCVRCLMIGSRLTLSLALSLALSLTLSPTLSLTLSLTLSSHVSPPILGGNSH